MEGFDILAVTSDHVYSSLGESRFKDFEDVLQFHSARNCQLDNHEKQEAPLKGRR
jgi:hypothetical protein